MSADLVSAVAASAVTIDSSVKDVAEMYALVSALMARLPYKTLKIAFADFDANVVKLRKLGADKRMSDVLFAEWSSSRDVKALCDTDGNAHTTLLWLNRGLELVVAMLTRLADAPTVDLAIREVYEASLAKHHSWWQKKLVSAMAGSTISAAQLDEYLDRPKHLDACRRSLAAHVASYAVLEKRAAGEQV